MTRAAPGQAKKVAMIGSLNPVTRQLIVHTSATKHAVGFPFALDHDDRLQARPLVVVLKPRDVMENGGHAQVRAALGPRTRQIRVRQGIALIAIEENDVAGLGLGLAQLKAQPHALDLAGALAAFQRVPAGAAVSGSFFGSALDNCDLPILTPSRSDLLHRLIFMAM